jgi:hypothetical protein
MTTVEEEIFEKALKEGEIAEDWRKACDTPGCKGPHEKTYGFLLGEDRGYSEDSYCKNCVTLLLQGLHPDAAAKIREDKAKVELRGDMKFNRGEIVRIRLTGDLGMIIRLFLDKEYYAVRLTDYRVRRFFGFELDSTE